MYETINGSSSKPQMKNSYSYCYYARSCKKCPEKCYLLSPNNDEHPISPYIKYECLTKRRVHENIEEMIPEDDMSALILKQNL